MIINGGKRAFWRKFAPYLMDTRNGAQEVRLIEIRGLAADNVADAFQELVALGSGTRAKNFYYHANINPRADEYMTEEQWEHAVDTLEKNLGLEGRSRIIVEHDHGRPHRHVVWSRVTDDMKVVPCDWNYSIHQRTADQLEQEFGHKKTPRKRTAEQDRAPEHYEHVRGQDSRIDPKDVRREVTELWRQADTGKAFAAALEEHGYILAKGDDRDFVIIDRAGDDHSLSRRVEGARAADIRKRMADVDRASLPTVAEARGMARGRASDRDDDRAMAAVVPDSSPASNTAREVLQEVGASPPDIGAPHERPIPEPSSEAEPEPAADATPWEPEPSAFDRLAQKLTEALHRFEGGITAAESIDPHGQPIPPSPSDARFGPPEHGVFEHAVKDLLTEAKKAAPVLAEAAAVAIAAKEHGVPEAVRDLTEFERIGGALKRARRDGAPSLPATLKRLEDRLGRERAAHKDTGREFRRVAEASKRAIRENGGEPVMPGGMTFWQRTGAVLSAARERAESWTRDVFTSFVERVRGSLPTPHQEQERER